MPCVKWRGTQQRNSLPSSPRKTLGKDLDTAKAKENTWQRTKHGNSARHVCLLATPHGAVTMAGLCRVSATDTRQRTRAFAVCIRETHGKEQHGIEAFALCISEGHGKETLLQNFPVLLSRHISSLSIYIAISQTQNLQPPAS